MTAKFRNKYRIESTRLKNWDYGSPGLYFVTLCTHDRICYFGDIVTETRNTVETQNIASQRNSQRRLRATEIGAIAQQYWEEIPNHFPFVELDTFVIMPNHVHGILFFNKPDYHDWNPNTFGPQSQNLGSVIRGFKTGVKTYATIHLIDFKWQSGYHDRIIRTENELNRIRQYIIDNPMKWDPDKDNNEDLKF